MSENFSTGTVLATFGKDIYKGILVDKNRQTYSWADPRIRVMNYKIVNIFPLVKVGFPLVKNPPADAGDTGSIPGLRRSPGGQNGNPLQYSCMENPMDREASWVVIHEVAKNQTWLRDQACIVRVEQEALFYSYVQLSLWLHFISLKFWWKCQV